MRLDITKKVAPYGGEIDTQGRTVRYFDRFGVSYENKKEIDDMQIVLKVDDEIRDARIKIAKI